MRVVLKRMCNYIIMLLLSFIVHLQLWLVLFTIADYTNNKKWDISAKFQGIGIQFYSQFGSAIIEEDL